MKFAARAFVAMLVISASGCAAGASATQFDGDFGALYEEAQDSGLAADSFQMQALADGEVTYDEYRTGVSNEIACAEEHGFVVAEVYTNKYDSWRISWRPDYEASKVDANDAALTCSIDNRMYLEIAYSLTAQERVDASLLAGAADCLNSLSSPPDASDESVAALVDSTGDQDGVLNCLDASLQRLYPEEEAGYVFSQ